MKKSIMVYYLPDQVGSKYFTVYRCRGIAADKRSCKEDQVQSAKLWGEVNDNNEIDFKNLDTLYYAESCSDSSIRSDFYTNKMEAMQGLIHRIKDSDEAHVKVHSATFNKDVIYPNRSIILTNMERMKNGEFSCKINMHPEVNGIKFATYKRFFANRVWTDVCEGPAYVTITHNHEKSGFVLGSMVRFDTLSFDELTKLVSEVVKKELIGDMEYVSVHGGPRGEYFSMYCPRTDTYFVALRSSDGNTYITDDYDEIVRKDIKESEV